MRQFMKISIPLTLIVLTFVMIPYDAEGIVTTQIRNHTNSSSGGPTINWDPYWNSTIAMDGTYTGQTQEIFEWSVWVNDSDGVDTVLFRFSWIDTNYWVNRTSVRIAGNATDGKYYGNLTWTAPKGGTFHLKYFANDTLGNWSESPNMTVSFGYYVWRPYDLVSVGIIMIFGIGVICVSIIIIWKYRFGRIRNPAKDSSV